MSSKRNYYIISPRVIIKAIIITWKINASTWKMNASTLKMNASTWKMNTKTWKMNPLEHEFKHL